MAFLLLLASISAVSGTMPLVLAQQYQAGVSIQGLIAHAGNLTGCYADPSDPVCVDFRQSDADSLEDLEELCIREGTSMPYMVVCSLWNACKEGTARGPPCQPFSLVGSGCVDMPGMSGCKRFKALCRNPQSVVKQCKDEPPLPHVLTTMQARKAIAEMCASHYMEGCDNCKGPSGFGQCAHPLETLSELCLGMPGMAQCDGFVLMCKGQENDLESICSTGSQPDHLPPMKMYFHGGILDVILFRGWVPRNDWQYALSCIVIIVLGVVTQACRGYRSRVEAQWHRHAVMNRGMYPARVPLRNLVRSAFTVVIATLDFFLMLVAMTFNVGLFICVVAGLALGSLLLGHWMEGETLNFFAGEEGGSDVTLNIKPPGANSSCGCGAS
eukprot:jgi/Botrbrau1/579/Bobra.0010s0045.1